MQLQRLLSAVRNLLIVPPSSEPWLVTLVILSLVLSKLTDVGIMLRPLKLGYAYPILVTCPCFLTMLHIEGRLEVRGVFNVAEVPFRGLTLTSRIPYLKWVRVVDRPIVDAAPLMLFPRPVIVTRCARVGPG